MKRLDNKGFAITGILYTLLILFLMILLSVFGGLRAKKNMLEKSTEFLEQSFLGDASKSDQYIASVIENRVAPVSGKYVFELDSAKNLVYNLYDSSGQDSRASYTITNKKVTITSKVEGGYIFIPAKVGLIAGTTYTFTVDTNGIWGNAGGLGGDTIEIWLMKYGNNNENSPNIHIDPTSMNSEKKYTFIAQSSGDYRIRIGINRASSTYYFNNLRITDNIHKNSCYAYLARNDAIQNGRVVFVPKDCNEYNYTFSFDNSNPDGLKMTLKQVYSFESE